MTNENEKSKEIYNSNNWNVLEQTNDCTSLIK